MTKRTTQAEPHPIDALVEDAESSFDEIRRELSSPAGSRARLVGGPFGGSVVPFSGMPVSKILTQGPDGREVIYRPVVEPYTHGPSMNDSGEYVYAFEEGGGSGDLPKAQREDGGSQPG